MSFVSRGRRLLAACAAGTVLCTGVAVAQAPPPSGVVEPPAVLLPNYGRVLIGSQAAMEGGALICRAKATEAAWYNPAGVVRSKHPTFMANASLYELATCTFEGGDTQAESSNLTTLPSFIGKTGWMSERPGEYGKLAWGYTIATPVAWESNVDSYEEFTYMGGNERVTTESHTKFSTLAVGVVLSYAVTPPYAEGRRLTLGFSGNLYSTALSIGKSRFDDWSDGADVKTETFEHELSVSANHIGLTFGAYYRLAPNWECAVVARLPGMKLSATGELDEHSLLTDSNPSGTDPEYDEKNIRMTDVAADWQVPMELSAGFAYNGEKFDWEIDVNYHAGAGTYGVFPSGLYDRRYGDIAGPFTPSTPAFDALQTTSQPVFDWAFGCRYELVEDKSRLHAGVRTCLSPIDPDGDNDFFQAVDLVLITIGYSSQTENTFTSMGLCFGFGGTEDYRATDLGSGDPVTGSLSVTTMSLFMGASFKL